VTGNLTPNSDSVDFSLSASRGRIATAFISEYTFHSPFLHQDVCRFQGHVIVSGA
jgi:hypothetical protein